MNDPDQELRRWGTVGALRWVGFLFIGSAAGFGAGAIIGRAAGRGVYVTFTLMAVTFAVIGAGLIGAARANRERARIRA